MLHDPPGESRTLGADLRALRKARGVTLADLAETLGRSVGWLSQVERDISEPSITDLRQIAGALDAPMSTLFRVASAPGEEGYVVRKTGRRPMGSRTAGLVEELLSPDLTDDFEVVHSVFEPRSQIAEAVTRATTEVGYVVAGHMQLWINDRLFDLHPGDSFRIKGEPFRWINPHDAPCTVVWVISPPIY